MKGKGVSSRAMELKVNQNRSFHLEKVWPRNGFPADPLTGVRKYHNLGKRRIRAPRIWFEQRSVD